MKAYIIFFTKLLLLVGCAAPEYLNEQELQAFISEESNKLARSKTIGELKMRVMYRPNDFLIWQEVEGESDTSKIREAFDRYEDYLYFMMQLSTEQKDALYGLSGNQIEFNDRLQTLSFRMNQYVNLTTSNRDTIPVADFYYSRMFGLAKSNDILFVFNRAEIGDSEWVSFNTKEFGFRSGRQSFRFAINDLNGTPKLEELILYRAKIE